MTDYNEFYRDNPKGLGDQDAGVRDCLERLPAPPLHILDFGAGQGRDAIPLARAGYSVTAVDPAVTGMEQLAQEAATEGLDIECVIGTAENVSEPFDVLLSDRTLHMIIDDAARHAALRHLLGLLSADGYVLIEDERSNMAGLRRELEHSGKWEWLEEKPVRLFARRIG